MIGQSNRGFTMMELVVVVMITAAMVGFGVPAISGSLTSMRLQTTARTFASDLRRARVEALRRNVAISVRGLLAGSYEIDSIGQRTLDGGVTFTAASADSVRFASFGPSLTGAVTFVLSIGGDSVTVAVTASGMSTITNE